MPDPQVTLYTAPLSMFAMKVEIALREKAVPFHRISVPYDGLTGYAPKHPDVLRVNPKAQVPVLLHGAAELFDSTQILEYIEETWPAPPLWPATPVERAMARQIELFSDEIYFPNVIKLFDLQDDLGSSIAQTAITALQHHNQTLDTRLANQPFVCGTFTFADIAVFMAQLFAERMSVPLTITTPRLMAWRTAMVQRPSVAPTLAPMIAFLQAAGRFVPDYIRVN